MKHPPVARDARQEPRRRAPAPVPVPVPTGSRALHGPPLPADPRSGGLVERWERATADPVSALPGRADLERRFGASLSRVRVHAGAGARSLLDHLGAQGAASGSVVLLRDTGAATVAHEVAHVLQASGPGPVGAPVRADHPAEREAEALAGSSGPARVRERLTPGALALRRTALLVRDPEVATAEEPTGIEDLDRDPDVTPAAPEPERAEEDLEGGVPEDGVPQDGAPRDDVPQDTVVPDEEPSPEQAAPEQAEAPPEPASAPPRRERPPDRAVGLPPPSPDRGIALREVIHSTQRTWDAGVQTIRSQDLGVCPDVAAAQQPGPVARGPPPAPPPAPPRDELPVPQLAEPDTSALDRARLQAAQQLDQAPARGPPPDVATLTDDERRARTEDQQRLAERIRAAAPPGVRTAPAVATAGPADPARAGPAEQALRERARTARTRAHDEAAADVGEERIGPARDPTAGHDGRLDGVAVPEVDVAAGLDEARLARVATDANAGRVPIADAVLVPDGDLAGVERTADAQEPTRARVDADVATAEADLARTCTEARRTRGGLQADARAGVATRRQEWTAAGDRLLDARLGEGEQLRRSEVGRAERIRRDADTRAARTVADARADAGRRWDDARSRARTKAEQGADRSWFRRGIDWVREQLARLVDWIDRFLAAARRAIDALLDAAAALAHAVVDAAHRTITAVLDRLQTLLERLAAALPGELGEVARVHLGRIQEFLAGVQKQVDTWADDLHRAIDERIGSLKADLHAVLDDLQNGVHAVAAGVDALLANGLLEVLRQQFPGLAALIDTGLDGVVGWAADGLDAWVDTAMEVTGLADLERTLDELDIEALCQERATQESAEQQAEDCAAFQQRLEGAMKLVDELLASPAARQIQDFLRRHQQAELGAELDALEDFFDFVHAVVAPVYRWWQETSATVERAIEALGEVARAAWMHIAAALGIDPDLGPLEALRRGIQALWQAVVDAARPLVNALKQAWRWLSEGSALAPLFTLVGRLPELWTALKDLWDRVVQGGADWLASAADALSRTVLPVVNRLLGAVSGVAQAVVGALDTWSGAVLAAVDAVLGWQSGLALLDAVLRAVARVTSPARRLLAAARACLVATLRWLAVQIRDLASHVHVLLDVATGLAFALLSFPIGMVGFLAGNVWLHVLPACYKPAIITFLLDVAIRFVRFLPEPAELGHLILYQGLLSFLVGLRTAPDAQKVGAVDLLASLYAGNAEFAAGFVVGVLEGIWAATGGTVVFLLQAALWLATLPFKLAAWSVGMLAGTLQAADGGGATADGGGEARPDGATRGLLTRSAVATANRAQREERGRTPRVLPRPGAVTAQDEMAGPEPAEPAVADPVVDGEPAPADPAKYPVDDPATAPVEPEIDPDDPARSAPGVGTDEAAAGSADRDVEPAPEPEPPIVAMEPPPTSDLPAVLAGPNRDRDRDRDDTTADTTATPAPLDLDDVLDDGTADEMAEPGPDPDTGAAPDEAPEVDPGAERPPPAPAGLTDLGGVLQKLVTEGLSRDDLRQAMEAGRGMLRGAVDRLAQTAARAMLAALNTKGVAYDLGKTVGAIVGQLLAEAVLAALTAGASAAIAAAKVALQGAKVSARFASLIAQVRRVLEPIFAMVQKLRSAIGELISAVRRWLDDVLTWMRGLGDRARRLLGRGKGRRGPARKKPLKTKRTKKGPKRNAKGRAMLAAKLMSDAMEARGMTVGATLLALRTLRGSYPFIQGFEADPAAAGTYTMFLIASKKPFDTFGTKKKRKKPRGGGNRHGAKGPPVVKPGAKLDERGLSPSQNAWFRKKIDAAQKRGASTKADDIRYQRYRLGNAQKSKKFSPGRVQRHRPPLTKGDHRRMMAENKQRFLRGKQSEQKILDRLGVENNNTSPRPKAFTHQGTTTIPDGVPKKGTVVEVKDVRSKKGVHYLTKQLRAQRAGGRQHVVVLTGKPRSLLRPSGPLGRPKVPGTKSNPANAVFHIDHRTGRWSVWDPARGGWRRSSIKAARQAAGTP